MKNILKKINLILQMKLSYGKDENGNEIADQGPQFSTLGGTLFLVWVGWWLLYSTQKWSRFLLN